MQKYSSVTPVEPHEEISMLVNLFEAEKSSMEEDLVRALARYTAVLAVNPKHADTWMRIGRTYLKMQNWAAAVPALETALQLQPNFIAAEHGLAYAKFNLGQKEQAKALIDDLCKRCNEPGMWTMRAYIHSHADSDPVKALKVHQDWGRRFADPLTRKAKPLVVADRNPRKRLRVGYVTADFREHSVAFFMMPVLKHHNLNEVEVHVYSSGKRDGITDAMQQLVPYWHEVKHLSDEALCELIRSHQIDVLVDLSGHTAGNRLMVFARRAAPVQVTWLGYMQPLGMKAMDYRLVDYGIAPKGHESYYSEKLFRLRCMASYAPPTYAPLCEQLPMMRNGYPTLISLNNSAKITDQMLSVWAKILRARPDARLIIMVKEATSEAAQANMQPRVEAAGMPLDRVFVMPQLPLNQFMELGHIADVALDTSPISGGTTTLHALWMGLLLVTLDAERGVDASTARTLRGLGFGGEIAKEEQGYIDSALLLMNSPDRLQALRLDLRDRLRASVLMDYANRTTELEKAFRLMWINFLKGNVLSLDVDSGAEKTLVGVEA